MTQMMTTHQMAVAIMGALFAFKHKWDADLEVQEADRALMSPEQQADTEDTVLPAEMEGEEWFEHFCDYLSREGLEKFLRPLNPDIKVMAALKKGEPSFTLRGQDILSSILVRHWSELASLGDAVRASKLEQAEAIAEVMEKYHPQKWPD